MTAPSTFLARPPSEGAPAPPDGGGGGGGAPQPPAQATAWARRHPRRVGWIAFGISAAVHLLALLLYPEITVRFGEMDPTADASGPVDVQGIEVVNLQETAADELEGPARPEDTLEPDAPRPVTLVRPPGESVPLARPVRPGDGLTAADRLRPSTREEDLWIPLVPEAVTLTEEEILQSLIYGQLAAFNDSMAVRAAQAARGTDWTYTDEDGNRWGISPGRLHLGKLTIPLPFSFGAPAGASDDLLDAQSMDREIRRAAGQFDADASVEERAAAIRARVDAERARRAAASDSTRRGGGGS